MDGSQGNNGNLDNGSQGNPDDGNQDDDKSTSTGTTSSRDNGTADLVADPVVFKRKRKYNKNPPPPRSDIQTRGVKVPTYQLFERRKRSNYHLGEGDAGKDEVVKRKKVGVLLLRMEDFSYFVVFTLLHDLSV